MFLWGCGSSAAQRDFLFPIDVDQDQTSLIGQTCHVVFSLVNGSSTSEYSLIWMKVVLMDAQDNQYEKTYDLEGLLEIFPQVQIPPRTTLVGEMALDISQSTLVGNNFEGSIQAIAVTTRKTIHFSGPLICQ